MNPEDEKNRRPLKSRDTALAKKLAAALLQRGIQPNVISVASIGFACIGAVAFLLAGDGIAPAFFFILAIVGIQGRLLCNLLDGMVAIEGGKTTPLGPLFNEIPDRLADTFLIVAAGYASTGCPCLTILGWSAAVLALFTAYVRAIGAALTGKHFYTGPMAKQQRMALLTGTAALAVFLAEWRFTLFELSLLVMNIGCIITLYRRLKLIALELRAK